MKRVRSGLGALAVLLVALSSLAPAAGAAGTPAVSGASVTARTSSFGRILFDGRGRALYAFTRDSGGHSSCAGGCARAWPPYLVSARPRVGAGVRGKLINTTRRGDGALQVTYAGRPLYYYVGDRTPGEVLCQNVREFGGLWLVVRPSGQLVR